ncbi:hypothetical protein D3C87_1988460 [compost metagenome]
MSLFGRLHLLGQQAVDLARGNFALLFHDLQVQMPLTFIGQRLGRFPKGRNEPGTGQILVPARDKYHGGQTLLEVVEHQWLGEVIQRQSREEGFK